MSHNDYLDPISDRFLHELKGAEYNLRVPTHYRHQLRRRLLKPHPTPAYQVVAPSEVLLLRVQLRNGETVSFGNWSFHFPFIGWQKLQKWSTILLTILLMLTTIKSAQMIIGIAQLETPIMAVEIARDSAEIHPSAPTIPLLTANSVSAIPTAEVIDILNMIDDPILEGAAFSADYQIRLRLSDGQEMTIFTPDGAGQDSAEWFIAKTLPQFNTISDANQTPTCRYLPEQTKK